MENKASSVTLDLVGQNAGFVSELFDLYQKDKLLVPREWCDFFDRYGDTVLNLYQEDSKIKRVEPGKERDQSSYINGSTDSSTFSPRPSYSVLSYSAPFYSSPALQDDLVQRVSKFIHSWRSIGHLKAKTNPLTSAFQITHHADLDLANYNFSEAELESQVPCDDFQGTQRIKLKDLIYKLEKCYADVISVEYQHLLNSEAREWIRNRFEQRHVALEKETAKRVFKKLVAAQEFEANLHKRYVGQKRFSLQGGETLIPVLDAIVERGIELGVQEIIFGKAHRGRLNVLANILGKPLSTIFTEFEDKTEAAIYGEGDVKYHKGYASEYKNSSGAAIRLSLTPNPSHLEFVNPVVEGQARALQDMRYYGEASKVLPLLMHGDAAFIGQGIVHETFNLSRVKGYATGGTLHIVINNQIGFTTEPVDSRSTTYTTDLAKAFEAPIFHINAEDVDACIWGALFALEYRQLFATDVVLDLVCYRKYGHNEGDDPSFTQPLIYEEVNKKVTIAAQYGKKLINEQVINEEEFKQQFKDYHEHFNACSSSTEEVKESSSLQSDNEDHIVSEISSQVVTRVAKEILYEIAKTLTDYPAGFTAHPKIDALLQKRIKSLTEKSGIEWGLAEALAYGSLMLEGRPVRISGQDCQRGTFSHRHLVLHDVKNSNAFSPLTLLKRLGENVANFSIFNSTLSEAAVLGFEFGYAAEARQALVIWEAQFGDFVNGAQVIVDQFISSSQAKWHQQSGVTLLLPHGFEGQGPEHSSARLERFLQLACGDNIRVCYPSSASQIFHLLRSQGLDSDKKPLIVMTPKSLLRLPEASASLSQLSEGEFAKILVDEIGGKSTSATFILTGKIFYEIYAALSKATGTKAKIIRIEELNPFPKAALEKALKTSKTRQIYWVQEEPKNQGAWSFINQMMEEEFNITPEYIGRRACASPATGSPTYHAKEQRAIIDEVFSKLIS